MNVNPLPRVVSQLVFQRWLGLPIPRRLKPDGIWTHSGVCVRYDNRTIGFIWREWFESDGDQRSVLCRQLADETVVTRATSDRAAAAFALASEWVAKHRGDAALMEPEKIDLTEPPESR